MNVIPLLAAQPWVERLGWTLLHFLWQGVLIAAVYAVARILAARYGSPTIRYILACATLAVMAAAPILTWIVLRPEPPEMVAASFTAPLSAAASVPVRSLPVRLAGDAYRAAPPSLLPVVVAVWFAGVLALWLRLFTAWACAERLRSRLVRPAPTEWQQFVDRLKARVGVYRPVRLLVSSVTHSPAVVGWLRPVVLMPVGALAGLPVEQLEALLLHELAHIRRHDYLVNLAQSVVEAMLFYHPGVWWISGHIRAEREHCCDDMAVAAHGDALTYARALAELEAARLARFQTVMAAAGGSLAHRIARLLGQPRPASRGISGPGLVATALLLAVTAFVVFGQPAARPKFEVASIKPSHEQRLQSVLPVPGRLTADASVRLLMQNAYTVQPFQIVGLPERLSSARYAIEAKAAGNPSRAQMFLMLQSLLEERFQLKIHRETRELPVYALVAARSGFKLPPPKDGACMEPAPGADPEWAGGRMRPPGQGRPLAPCGSIAIFLETGGARLQGGKVAMPELVRMLSMVLGRAVIDKTGFTGLFDVQLQFLPDETTATLPPPPPDPSGAPPDSRSPSIVTALPEQLGLRIESTKGPVEVIVVDHIEAPSSN